MADQYARQSFLGPRAQERIQTARVAIIGLGGGGSHVAQQLAHIGFQQYVLLDPQGIEDTNLNRTVGAIWADVQPGTLKVEIAKRHILSITPTSVVEALPDEWQNHLNELKRCDLIFGCIDGFMNRRDFEGFARRYLIPYIDIGMDVHLVSGEPPRMAGQVFVSMPAHPCMYCVGLLTEANLAMEATLYGEAGESPQVVWSNGVLASTAVGLTVDLITDWSVSLRETVFLSFDGNKGTLNPDVRFPYVSKAPCPHYPISSIGEPRFISL